MKKNIVLLGVLILVIIGGIIVFNLSSQKTLTSPSSSKQEAKKEIKPSLSFIEYTDPSGFSFSYPDNLSIVKNESADANTYADLQLEIKDVKGSLNLKIEDTKLKTLEEWLKSNKITPESSKEANLGNLKALEVKTSGRLMLVAIDQGILFTIEIPLTDQDFWMKVYKKVSTDFSFVSSQNVSTDSNNSENDVSFEGEEVVE